MSLFAFVLILHINNNIRIMKIPFTYLLLIVYNDKYHLTVKMSFFSWELFLKEQFKLERSS